MNYSVIIVTYNRLELLKKCLNCIDNQSMKFDSIVIINNCSTDGTKEYLEEYCLDNKNTILVNTEKNLGGAGGFEIGVNNIPADADYVLFIDDDALLDASFLKEIDAQLEDGIRAYSGTIITEGDIDKSHRRQLKSRILMTKKDIPEEAYKRDFFLYNLSTFCGLMISKEIIDKIGSPKGEYFIWYDDTEYCLRIMRHSVIKNVNKAIINHMTSTCNEGKLSWKSYYGYRNQIDIGKNYSKCPLLFCIYRYSYHFYRVLNYYGLAIIHPRQKYYVECARLHKAVIRDAQKGLLGVSNEFYPGKDLG